MLPVFRILTVASTHLPGATEVTFKVTVSTTMAACDLIFTFKGLGDAAFNARLVISSEPEAVELIGTIAVVALGAIVISRSMNPVPLIVFDAEEFIDKPT